MSSSGLIYAVIVGAWAAYLVPMWLRRQDELNEARPTERFSTAIRLLSGRAGMERRYAKGLEARSAEEDEQRNAPEGATDSVDVRAFAVPPARRKNVDEAQRDRHRPDAGQSASGQPEAQHPERQHAGTPRTAAPQQTPKSPPRQGGRDVQGAREPQRDQGAAKAQAAASGKAHAARQDGAQRRDGAVPARKATVSAASESPRPTVKADIGRPALARQSRARVAAAAEAAARARRSKVLARRRRTTVVLFLAFTLGAVFAGVRGLAFLWAPALPALLLSVYIVYLRGQERSRFTYTMDRRRAEAAARRLREHGRGQRRRSGSSARSADDAEEGPASATDPALSSLSADRRALVEQTDHAEWVDQQREPQRGLGPGDSWDPVPVPLPTYVTAPVAPRATGGVDLGDPDVWSSARSSASPGARDAAARRDAGPSQEAGAGGAQVPAGDEAGGSAAGSTGEGRGAARSGRAEDSGDGGGTDGGGDADGEQDDAGGERSDARRAASARRARERGRTPLFDQYEDGTRPRAANE